MEHIIQGVQEFTNAVFPEKKELFERLAASQQKPRALFITCSDSRVEPNLITQTEPGDLFLLRNAGNIVPPYGAAPGGGTGATIEYSIAVLGIRNVIVCGHSHCGAMEALLHPESVRDLPEVAQWVTYAEATRRIAKHRYGHLHGYEFDRAVIEENVLVQLNNLSTHPVVAARLATGDISLFGWYYEIETGVIYEYNQHDGQFLQVTSDLHPATPSNIRKIVPRPVALAPPRRP